MPNITCLTTSSSSALTYPIAFGDKKYKTLRVLADLFSHLVASAFYRVVATCAWLSCLHGAAHKYDFLARQHYRIGAAHLGAFAAFEKNVINFAWNGPKKAPDLLPKGVSELDALRVKFGEQTISNWLKIGTKELPLRQELLRRSGINDGCCFGGGLEFNAKYLKGIKKGLTPLEAVKNAGYRYEKGATDKAELIQIFGNALSIPEQEKAHMERDMEKRYQILARQVGLNAEKRIVCPQRDMTSKSKELEAFIIKHLPEGVYGVDLNPVEKIGHAISVIKVKDNYFLFNMNRASLSLTLQQLASTIQRIAREELRSSACQVSFTPLKASI